ncbi:MAG: hypothetical protein KIT34_11880 [Cyanobacteria bacterium TGS_CYA1]|nr:hypothetical protein [Cyanobacteria bacterium TGS_CYA1]
MAFVLLDDPVDSIELELKTEPERFGSGPGGSSRPPRRTALGYMGEDDDAWHNMRKWQRMKVKIIERGLQGYKVWLLATGDFAFLKTDLELEIGSTCDGLFQQWNKDGTATFIPATKLKSEQPIEPQSFSLKDLLPFQESQKNASIEFKSSDMDDPTDVLPGPLSISEFAPIDLIRHKLADYLDWFKQNSYTGIVKYKHPRFNSYGALVLFRGRCTGAMFSCEGQQNFLSTEQALPELFTAMCLLGADVFSYTLPEEIVLPITAGFIGYQVQPQKENSKDSFEYMIDRFAKYKSIALLVLSSRSNGTMFVYVYKGKVIGFFSLEHKTFFLNETGMFDFVSNNTDIELYISVLPNEIVLKSFQFGFELEL